MKKKLYYGVLTGLMAAMITLTTAYILHIPVGLGYIHLGDTMVYLAAAMLPTPYAVLAAAVGGCLADVLCSAAMWAPFTAVIKGVMAFAFTAKNPSLLGRRNLWAIGIAGCVNVGGYYVAEVVLVALSGSTLAAAMGGAAAAVFPNCIQSLGGGLAFVLLALALDRLKVKQRVFRANYT